MAKSRVSINPLYTGGAGGYSFYVRSGEQVVRQRKNNSNYGASASRSYAQMIRRIRWGNLVNVYKAIKSWQAKAYDSKLAGQTDYNIFMQLNINQATVGTTKEMNEGGCAVIEAYQVSRGSLPPIDQSLDSANLLYKTGLVYTQAIGAATTVGEFSTEIIANNPMFQNGDNVAFIFLKNWLESRVEWPYVTSVYTEITLDVTSTALVQGIANLGTRLSKSSDDHLAVSYTVTQDIAVGHEVGFVCIHTRKNAGQLRVSNQSILVNSDSIIQRFSGELWDQTCIDTYGLDSEVPLDPNFKEGVITKVTANGAVISNAASLVGSQQIRVYGQSLYGQGYRFVHDGVDYTPLDSTDEYDEFLLSANGSYTIYVNDQVYMSFSVTGTDRPSLLTGYVVGWRISSDYSRISASYRNSTNGCLNFDGDASELAPGFDLQLYVNEEPSSYDDLEIVNGEAVYAATYDSSLGAVTLKVTVTNLDSPCYIKWGDFIWFVGNY